MKSTSLGIAAALVLAATSPPASAQDANTIVLDENGVKNLRIETVEVEETDFEETVFALGRIEEIPERHAVLSSRISGRVVGMDAHEGDTVEKGRVLVRVESRQPGNPPPVIELEAPISGLVVQSHIRLGEPVEPDKELLDISDLSEVHAIARVPEHYAARLSPGSQAHIVVSALGEQIIEGEMLRFEPRRIARAGRSTRCFVWQIGFADATGDAGGVFRGAIQTLECGECSASGAAGGFGQPLRVCEALRSSERVRQGAGASRPDERPLRGNHQRAVSRGRGGHAWGLLALVRGWR